MNGATARTPGSYSSPTNRSSWRSSPPLPTSHTSSGSPILGEENGAGRVVAAPVQNEHGLLADRGQARSEMRVARGRLVVRNEAARVIQQTGVHQFGNGVDQPDPHIPTGLDRD